MRLAQLYSLSRFFGYTVLGLASVALLGWIVGSWVISRPFMDPETYLAPVLLLTALLSACLVGVGTVSPFGDVELTSSFPLFLLRFGHVGGLLVWSALALIIATVGWESDYAGWTLIRNLLGFTGLTLLAARLLGSRLSWLAPFAFYTLAVFTGRVEASREETDSVFGRIMGEVPAGEWERWAGSMRPSTDYLSWIIALTLLTCGLVWFCFRGVRESLEE